MVRSPMTRLSLKIGKKFLSDLLGELLGFQFLQLGDASLRLAAQKAATPMTANLRMSRG